MSYFKGELYWDGMLYRNVVSYAGFGFLLHPVVLVEDDQADGWDHACPLRHIRHCVAGLVRVLVSLLLLTNIKGSYKGTNQRNWQNMKLDTKRMIN